MVTRSTPSTRMPAARRGALALALALGLAALTGCLSADQQAGIDAVKSSRAANAKPDIAADLKTSDKAQAWSRHMADTGVLQHTGGGSTLNPSGIDNWCAVGENVGRGSSVQAVQNLFMADPPHRKNVLGAYDRVGVGVVKKGSTYWVTQIFVRSC